MPEPEAPKSPTVEEMPKMPSEFQTEVQKGVELKHSADTAEKFVMPTAEDVKQEKTHNEMMDGLEHFDKNRLSHCETEEKLPLPTKEDIKVEKQHQELISGVETFDKDALKHTKTEEKFLMPKDEMARDTVKNLCAKFDHSQLKKVKPTEKTNVQGKAA